jgi:hypothetical protein
MKTDRRSVIGGAAAVGLGIGLLPFSVDGKTVRLSPAQAREKGAAFKSLTPGEVRTLEAFGEALLPGAREEGIAHFVDHHISNDPAESLLMIRYMDVPPPYASFYKAGLAALDAHSKATTGKLFPELDAGQAAELVRAIAAAPPARWMGPPSPLFYFVLRSDAVDVVYGTEKGFERLGIPYMPHLLPDTKW